MDQILADWDSLMIYPEVTRNTDGKIAEFKKGAFRPVCITATSVLPGIVDGAYKALP